MNETQSETIYPGDSTDRWIITRVDSMQKPMLINDHTCSVKVEGTTIDRAIVLMQSDNKAFIGGLLPSETTQLAVGQTYTALVVLEKAGDNPPFKKTMAVMLHVKDKADCC